MKQSLVSILMPVCNGERYLPEALQSIADQTFKDYEVVAVDDGSTDKTLEILKAWSTPITILNHERNLGVGKALNDGLDKAQGTFISYLSCDDLFLPNKLETEVKAFRDHPQADVVYSDFYQLFPNGEERLIQCPPFDADRITHECFLNIGSSLIRKTVLDSAKFSEDLRYCVDGDLWQRLADCNFLHVPEPLSEYRIHPGQSSRELKAQFEALRLYGVSWLRLRVILKLCFEKVRRFRI